MTYITSGQGGGSDHGRHSFPLETCAELEQFQAQFPGLVPAPCQAVLVQGLMEHPGFGWQKKPARPPVLWRLQDPAVRPAQLLLSEELSALVQSRDRDYLLVRKSRMGSKMDVLAAISAWHVCLG